MQWSGIKIGGLKRGEQGKVVGLCLSLLCINRTAGKSILYIIIKNVASRKGYAEITLIINHISRLISNLTHSIHLKSDIRYKGM